MSENYQVRSYTGLQKRAGCESYSYYTPDFPQEKLINHRPNYLFHLIPDINDPPVTFK